MIAAFNSSKTKGPKKLTRDVVEFGWDTIQKIFSPKMTQCTWPEICICAQIQLDSSQCKTSQDHAGP